MLSSPDRIKRPRLNFPVIDANRESNYVSGTGQIERFSMQGRFLCGSFE